MNAVVTINSSLTIERTPLVIAAEINSIKEQTQKMILFNSIEIGRRLVEAKSLVAHGEWGIWLERNVSYSQSTANNLMRIFHEYGSDHLFGDNAKSQALGNLSYSQAVALLGIPAEEREQFMEAHDVENLSTRELQKAIKDKQELKKKLSNAKSTLDRAVEERNKAREEVSNLQMNIGTTNLLLTEKKKTIKMLQEELEKERQRTKSEVDRLVGLLNEARANGASDEKVKQLEDELREAREQVEALNEKLNQPVTIETAVVEKIPEEVERELSELRTKTKEQEAKKEEEKAILKFGVCFESLVKGFSELLGALAEIKENNQEEHQKYKKAVIGLIEKMSERLS